MKSCILTSCPGAFHRSKSCPVSSCKPLFSRTEWMTGLYFSVLPSLLHPRYGCQSRTTAWNVSGSTQQRCELSPFLRPILHRITCNSQSVIRTPASANLSRLGVLISDPKAPTSLKPRSAIVASLFNVRFPRSATYHLLR